MERLNFDQSRCSRIFIKISSGDILHLYYELFMLVGSERRILESFVQILDMRMNYPKLLINLKHKEIAIGGSVLV